MERLVIEAMRLMQEFAAKSADCTLTEYEALAYENTCRMVESFNKLQSILCEKAILEAERELHLGKIDHEKWLKGENDNDSGESITPVS